MKLLIITQKVDKNDPILGFFHRWIEEFSKHCESIIVICLYKGEFSLPKNVRVLSLGKETGESKLKYIRNFYKHIWNERKNYDKVFVHMNQEYILFGGFFWKVFKKDIFMWRNHHAGSFITDVSASFCKKIFCTSRFSYTAKYEKTILMPVGVDTENFKSVELFARIPRSILSLGRISPIKNIHILIESLGILKNKGTDFVANIYGDVLPQDADYYDGLKKTADNRTSFHEGIPNVETVKVYSAHDIFVNLSSSGMYDKTIFEAMACGCLVLASNENLRGNISDDFIFMQGNREELTKKIEKFLHYSLEERQRATVDLRGFALRHSLGNLGIELFKEINK